MAGTQRDFNWRIVGLNPVQSSGSEAIFNRILRLRGRTLGKKAEMLRAVPLQQEPVDATWPGVGDTDFGRFMRALGCLAGLFFMNQISM